MFSSISPKTGSTQATASTLAAPAARKAQAKSIPVFGLEIASSAAAPASAKIAPRQNSVAGKTSSVATSPAKILSTKTSPVKSQDQTLVAKSLTNKSLASVGVEAKATSVKAGESGGTSPKAPAVDPAEAVRALLLEFGYDPGAFKFESREEYVMYPGGGYTHRFTSVELPNGMKENFTTDLMGRYPAVTANELRRLMENQHMV